MERKSKLAMDAMSAALQLRQSEGFGLWTPVCPYDLAEKLGIHPGGGRFLKGFAWLRDMGVISGRSPIRIEEGAFV